MIPILSPNFKFKLFFMGPGFNVLIPFPIPTLNVFQYVSMLSSFYASFNWVKLVVPMQWDHFSINLNSHMIRIGFSKTHGYKISLGSISFGINFPKLCRKNFVTRKLQVKSIVPQLKKRIRFFHLSWILSKSVSIVARQLLPY